MVIPKRKRVRTQIYNIMPILLRSLLMPVRTTQVVIPITTNCLSRQMQLIHVRASGRSNRPLFLVIAPQQTVSCRWSSSSSSTTSSSRSSSRFSIRRWSSSLRSLLSSSALLHSLSFLSPDYEPGFAAPASPFTSTTNGRRSCTSRRSHGGS